MQCGKVYYYGNDCECTTSGKHHYEDMEDGTLWCRMCGRMVDDKVEVDRIKAGA